MVNQEQIDAISLAIETRFRTVLASEPVDDLDDLIGEAPMGPGTTNFPMGGILANRREWKDDRHHQDIAAWVAAQKPKKYEITIDIKEDDIEDDIAQLQMPQIDSLAVEMRNGRRDDAITIMTSTGLSTDYPIWDGAALFSASHVFKGSGLDAQGNTGSTAFAQAAFYTALASWQTLKRPNGTYFRRRRPTHFFHAINIQGTVDATFKCATLASGATNPLFGFFKPENIRAIPEATNYHWGFCNGGSVNKPIITGVRRAVRYTAVTDPKAGGKPFESGVFSFGFDCREVTFISAWWDWYWSSASA